MEDDSHLQLHLSVEKNKETTVQGSGRPNAAIYFYVFLFEYTGRWGGGGGGGTVCTAWEVIIM